MTLRLESSGERLDAALARLVPELSRSQAQRLLAQGLVTANGKPLKKNEKSTAGMVLELTLPEAQETDLPAQEIPLDIRYEDSDVIVINKPKGLVVHPAPGHPDGTVVNALLHHCGDSLSGIGGEKRPGIVHRIDKDTSGLLIAAKNDAAHAHLSAQLKDHTLARTYECIVCGNLKEDSGTIDAPIGRHPTDRKKMAVTEKNSRNAVTHWERPGLYAPALQAGNRQDAPDPRASCLAQPPDCGRFRLRAQKARVGTEFPVPACRGARFHPPENGKARTRRV